jgi:hypothetical protein
MKGVVLMLTRRTWEQIKKDYPEKWVRLEDVEWAPNNNATVESAIVTKADSITTQDRIDAKHGKCFVIYVDSGACINTGVMTTDCEHLVLTQDTNAEIDSFVVLSHPEAKGLMDYLQQDDDLSGFTVKKDTLNTLGGNK